jgi:iron uptake system component EfeO
VRPPTLLAAFVVTLVPVVAGCGSGSKTDTLVSEVGLVRVELTNDGCPKSLELGAGPTTFVVSNHDAAKVDELEIKDGDRVLGEIEDVTPGHSGSFSVTLKPGSYRTYCGSRLKPGVLTVTGDT